MRFRDLDLGPRAGLSGLGDASSDTTPGLPVEDAADLARRIFTGGASPPRAVRDAERPDRVAEMEGGRRFLIERRRDRRRDLLKEAVNVGLGSLVVWVVSGIVGWQAGASPGLALVVATVLALSVGWTLGREVVADVLDNEGVLKRGGRPR